MTRHDRAAGDGIVTRQLATRGLAVDRREAAYADAILHTLDTDFVADGCDVSLTGFHLGALHVIHCDASARRSARTPALIDRDRYDGVSFQYAITGQSIGRGVERAIVSDPDTVMILDFAQPFVMVDQDRRVVVNVAVPRVLLAKRVADPSALHGLILGTPAINLFRNILMCATDDRAIVTPGEGARLEGMLLDAIDIMLERGGTPTSGGAGSVQGALMARAVALVEARIGSQDLTPEWLADRLGLSRSELYRLFRPVGGVAKAIWGRRLDAARVALADPADRRRIGEIAYALGFASEPHFARTFKARFGATARQVREESRNGT